MLKEYSHKTITLVFLSTFKTLHQWHSWSPSWWQQHWWW